MEKKVEITKKFMFELSEEDIDAIRRVSTLIAEIEQAILDYDIDKYGLMIKNDIVEDWIYYKDLIAAERELSFLENCENFYIEEDITEF